MYNVHLCPGGGLTRTRRTAQVTSVLTCICKQYKYRSCTCQSLAWVHSGTTKFRCWAKQDLLVLGTNEDEQWGAVDGEPHTLLILSCNYGLSFFTLYFQFTVVFIVKPKGRHAAGQNVVSELRIVNIKPCNLQNAFVIFSSNFSFSTDCHESGAQRKLENASGWTLWWGMFIQTCCGPVDCVITVLLPFYQPVLSLCHINLEWMCLCGTVQNYKNRKWMNKQTTWSND